MGSLHPMDHTTAKEAVMLTDTNAYSGFAVDDIDKAKEFYGDTLGLKTTVLDEENGLITLHLAGGRDTLVYRKPDLAPANYTILNFEVDDIEAAVERGQVPRCARRAGGLGVGVDEPGAERQLRHHRRRAHVRLPHQPATAPVAVDVDPGEARLGGAREQGGERTGVAVVVLDQERAARGDQ